MLSALILAIGVSVPSGGFVIPTLKRPVPTLPQAASVLTVPATPAAQRKTRRASEPAGDVTCAIRSIGAPRVDEGMAREPKADVDRGMVVTSRCRAPEPPSPEPRR
jgi:hypothetical protein